MTPPHAIKEEIVTTSRSQEEVRICDDRATVNLSSPGPSHSHAVAQASPPPCSSAIRVPTVSHHVPFVSHPIGPPIISTQFYPRVRGSGYRTCSSEASVSIFYGLFCIILFSSPQKEDRISFCYQLFLCLQLPTSSARPSSTESPYTITAPFCNRTSVSPHPPPGPPPNANVPQWHNQPRTIPCTRAYVFRKFQLNDLL